MVVYYVVLLLFWIEQVCGKELVCGKEQVCGRELDVGKKQVCDKEQV